MSDILSQTEADNLLEGKPMPESKFAVGSFWRTKDGSKVKILANDLRGRYSLLGLMIFEDKDEDNVGRWLGDGKFGWAIFNGCDLIEPWVEAKERAMPDVLSQDEVADLLKGESMAESKFKVGSFWRTGGGKKAKILANDLRRPSPILGVIRLMGIDYIHAWRENGKTDQRDSHDLIEPWVDKPKIEVNWAAMPAWAKYVAMDANGMWWHYRKKPEHRSAYWFYVPFAECIPFKYNPKVTGDLDWRESLCVRPGCEEEANNGD
jgi:hypothetical protein